MAVTSPNSRNNAHSQALRIRRYFMAAGTSFLVIVLLVVYHLQGILSGESLLHITSMIIFWVFVFYILFLTGLNLKLPDPSLTVPQMTAATVTILYAMYAADGARSGFLVILAIIFFFGMLRLKPREFLFFSSLPLGGYLVVIHFLEKYKPETLDPKLEFLQWLTFAITLPWFAAMGGYFSTMRKRLKKALEAVQESEANLVEAQRIARLGSWTYEPSEHVAVWSEQTYRIFGIEPDQPAPVGNNFRRFIHPDDLQHYDELIEPALREQRNFDSQFRIVLPSSEIRWVHARGRPAINNDGRTTMLHGIVMDITERHVAEEQIRQLAHFDALTQLPNRNLFNQHLARALAAAERHGNSLAVLYIDLDGFKQINDTMGHEAGDSLLTSFGRRLQECLRKSDIAARLGGDEFVVMMGDFATRSDIESLAQRILDAAAKPFALGGKETRISASIGIGMYPQDGRNIESLTKNADHAMYGAKQSGKNKSWFYSSVTKR